MEDFKQIDKNMHSKNKKKLAVFAKKKGYKYFSEMVYILHVKEKRNAGSIVDWIVEETGEVCTTYDMINQMLKNNKWKIKDAKYDPPAAGEDRNGIAKCKRCGKNPIAKDRGFVYLCTACHGHRFADSVGFSHSEYSARPMGIMVN